MRIGKGTMFIEVTNMKKIIILLFALGLTACSATGSGSNAETAGLKQYSSIEQQRCPKARYPSVHKRLECKHRVREELNQPNHEGETQ